MPDVLVDRYMYFFVLALMAIGLYGMLAMSDLLKKVVGMAIFQTGIFLLFIEGSYIEDGTIPIVESEVADVETAYMNPLPHLLILTAIVVGVALIGVALALVVSLHRRHGTVDEDELIDRLPEQ